MRQTQVNLRPGYTGCITSNYGGERCDLSGGDGATERGLASDVAQVLGDQTVDPDAALEPLDGPVLRVKRQRAGHNAVRGRPRTTPATGGVR